MRKIVFIALLALIAGVIVSMADGLNTAWTDRQVRDPYTMRAELNRNFALLDGGVSTGNVARLATCVTNATLTLQRVADTNSALYGAVTNVTITLQR